MTLSVIASLVATILTAILLVMEIKRDLMMLQQNSYRPERYIKWMRQSGDSTSYVRLTGIFLVLFAMATFGTGLFASLIICIFAMCTSIRELTHKYKKPLVFTRRAVRILITSLVLTAIFVTLAVVGALYGAFGSTGPIYAAMVAVLLCYCISHGIVLAATYILTPVEKHINKRYYDDAVRICTANPDLKIIGVTGSYGKTSTKHFLYRILSEQYETLMTPGSFNTTMGVIRTIREQLKPYHEVFIVEMGAKQAGDIREICELVHPTLGIITAVGPQHLQTFGSIENVLATKFELADAIPADGTVMVNNDYDIIAGRKVDNCRVVGYSINAEPPADYRATDIEYSPYGTTFTVVGPKLDGVKFETRLLGKYNISDLVGAIGIASEMGMDTDKIRYAVTRIEPVEHRLSVIRYPGGLTMLDDAYNSNPAGAAMALEVLASMKTGRRFVLTPGMIELGDQQYELNRAFGEQIARSGIDYAVVICDYNRRAILDGLADGNMPEDRIKTFDTFLEANAWLVQQAQPGDTALIENDLPDTFK